MTPEEVDALRNRLVKKVGDQARVGQVFYNYYTAEHQPPSIRSQYSKSYELLLGMSNSPLARLVVDAIAERLEVTGVRVRDRQTDELAWNVWQRNRLDAYQTLVHRDALITGHGFVSVWPDPDNRSLARIMPESSAQVAVEYEPGSFREVRAALKLWRDGEIAYAILYTATHVYKWTARAVEGMGLEHATWEARGEVASNPMRRVPIVPFETRPIVYEDGRSELADLIPIIRRVDKLVLDMMLTAEVSAFMQRYIIGAEIERDEDGNPVPPFQAGADRIWMIEDKEAKIGQLQPAQLDGYMKAISSQIALLAAVSRVPAYYLYTDSLANPPSADSLRAGEAGLIFKVSERQGSYGESWEEVVRLALSIESPNVGDTTGMELIWRSPMLENPSAMADRAVKAKSVDVPTEALWEMIGAGPQEIARWRSMRAEEEMTALLTAPPVTVDEPAEEEQQPDAAE